MTEKFAYSLRVSLCTIQKAEVDKQIGVLKMSHEKSERRTLEAERRLDELIQGQAISEQEVRKAVDAQQDLDDVKEQLNVTKAENLVNTFLLLDLRLYFVFISFR